MKKQNDIEIEMLEPTKTSPKPVVSKKKLKKWAKVMARVKF